MARLNAQTLILRKRVASFTAFSLPTGIALSYLHQTGVGLGLIGMGSFCLAAIVMDLLTHR